MTAATPGMRTAGACIAQEDVHAHEGWWQAGVSAAIWRGDHGIQTLFADVENPEERTAQSEAIWPKDDPPSLAARG